MADEWKEGICGCCNNPSTCVFGWFCPCWLYGRNQEKLDGASCATHCCIYAICGAFVCIPHHSRRQFLRERYNLKENPSDWLATLWCISPCAVCQEAREMEVRGPPPATQAM